MTVLPTSKVMKFAEIAPQGVLLIHIGKVLVDLGIVDSLDDYCVEWLGQTPYLFQVPKEFVWLDDEMRRRLLRLLVAEIIAAESTVARPGSRDEQDAIRRLKKLAELHKLVDAIPKLY